MVTDNKPDSSETQEDDGQLLDNEQFTNLGLDDFKKRFVHSEEDPQVEEEADEESPEEPETAAESETDDDQDAEDEPEDDADEADAEDESGVEEPEEAPLPTAEEVGVEEPAKADADLVIEAAPIEVWKKMPREAKDYVDKIRKVGNEAIKRLEADKPFTVYAKQTFDAAQSLGLQPQVVADWNRALLDIQQGKGETIQQIGELAERLGYKARAQSVDAKAVADYAIRRFGLSQTEAEDLAQWVGAQAPAKPAAPHNTQQVPAPQPPRQTPSRPREDDVRQVLTQLDTHLKNNEGIRYDYATIREKVVQRVTAEMLATAATPNQLKRLWFDTAMDLIREKRKAARKANRRDSKGGEELSSRPSRKKSTSVGFDPSAFSDVDAFKKAFVR